MPNAPTILVTRQTDGTYAVRARGAKFETSHVVSVPDGFHRTLGTEDIPEEELVRASFAFLLDREPASAVLPRFSLDVISRYFPEYRAELRNYTRHSTGPGTGPAPGRGTGPALAGGTGPHD